MLGMDRHSILLMQQELDRRTRTYHDYETLTQCLDGICRIFEAELRRLNPTIPTLTYDVSDLQRWIESLPDMSMLVYSVGINAYLPHDKEWIKIRVYQHLRRQAQTPQ